MNVYQWLCLIGVQSVITLILTRVITRRMDRAERTAETARNESTAIAAGLKALLRDRLLQGYKHYIEQGWADLDDRGNMENMFSQYHTLGGNGDMNDLRNTFRGLPLNAGGPPIAADNNREG